MRRLFAVIPVLALLAGCASASDVAARTTPGPATTAPVPARSCQAEAKYDSAGHFQWSGATYATVGQTTLKDKDTAGMLFAIGCDGAKAYALKGMRAQCEVLVLNTDAWDAYAPTPLPTGCPAPVTSSNGHIAGLPTNLADCPAVPSQKLGHHVSEDFGDALVVGDSNFVAESPPTTRVRPSDLGSEQFKVRCSYSELNNLTQQQTPELRSHDSTYVPAGQPVYAVKGWPPSCRLAAQHDNQWHVYVALDPKAGPGVPLPCAIASPTPSTLPAPTRTSSPVITGGFGTCPSPSPTESGSEMAVDYVDVLQANGRSYVSDYGMGHAAGSQRGAPQLTIGCTLSTWSDTYMQATMESRDGWATFLPVGTVVYAVKGHPPLCQLMAMLNSQWELFTSTEAGCPSPPPNPSHPPKT